MKRRKIVGYLVDPGGRRLEVKDRAAGEAIREMSGHVRELERQRDGILADFRGCLDALTRLQKCKWTRLGALLRVVRPSG